MYSNLTFVHKTKANKSNIGWQPQFRSYWFSARSLSQVKPFKKVRNTDHSFRRIEILKQTTRDIKELRKSGTLRYGKSYLKIKNIFFSIIYLYVFKYCIIMLFITYHIHFPRCLIAITYIFFHVYSISLPFCSLCIFLYTY